MGPAGCSKQEKAPTATTSVPEAIDASAKPYPLDTCLVCGMKLSMMDKPVTFVYQGQQIKVCDVSEKAEFEKDPAKYMKKIEEAEAAPKQ